MFKISFHDWQLSRGGLGTGVRNDDDRRRITCAARERSTQLIFVFFAWEDTERHAILRAKSLPEVSVFAASVRVRVIRMYPPVWKKKDHRSDEMYSVWK